MQHSKILRSLMSASLIVPRASSGRHSILTPVSEEPGSVRKINLKSKFWTRFLWSQVGSAFRKFGWFRSSFEGVLKDNAYLGAVERAFTELREHANKIQAKAASAEFHKHELEARGLQVLERSVSRPEAWTNAAYRTLSDYGDSFMLPIIWLVIGWALWTLVYFGMSGWHYSNLEPAAVISL